MLLLVILQEQRTAINRGVETGDQLIGLTIDDELLIFEDEILVV